MIKKVLSLVDRAKQVLARCDKDGLIRFVAHLLLASFAAVVTPMLFRCLFARSLVERTDTLDFTFKTCTDQLHGVCSFPEAQLIFSEAALELEPGLSYDFVINLNLLETSSFKKSGLFLTQIELKNRKMETLDVMKRSVIMTESLFAKLYEKARNLAFFPLYLTGFFPDETRTHFLINFPRSFKELTDNRSEYLVLQIQNRLAHIEFATVTIRAHVSLFSFILSQYPLSSYLFLLIVSGAIYTTVLFAYWAEKGILALSEEEKVKEDLDFSEPLKLEPNSEGSAPSSPQSSESFSSDNWEKVSTDTDWCRIEEEPDDLPEIPDLRHIPGWNVAPVPGQAKDK